MKKKSNDKRNRIKITADGNSRICYRKSLTPKSESRRRFLVNFYFLFNTCCTLKKVMAFMMPVVKNDYNIYKSNRNRRVSECSNDKTSASSASSCGGTRRVHSGSRSADGPSLSTSPGSDFMVGSPAHRSLGGVSKQTAFHHGSLQHHHGAASRNSSRNSQSSLQSPAKSSSSSSSPPKVSSTSSLNMFHSKLVDKLRRSLTSKSKDSECSSLNKKNN